MIGALGLMYQGPLSANQYSAAPGMFAAKSSVHVSGSLIWGNGTNAALIPVRLFATDQLLEDNMTTDEHGHFLSTRQFLTGQILTLTTHGQRFTAFIPYDAGGGDYYLGRFMVINR